MGKIIGLLFCITILFSCKKDKVPFPCTGISMLGDRSVFIGKWRWYKTTIEQWFDLGPSIYSDYTPQNQGFEYYFTISTNGIYKGYKDGILIENFIMNDVYAESFWSTTRSVMGIMIECSSNQFRLGIDQPLINNDSLDFIEQPYNFDDPINKLRSKINYFVREQ